MEASFGLQRHMARVAGVLSSVFLLGACSGSVLKLERPVPETKKISNNRAIEINPEVDILFVIDDSGSMAGHQANLAANVGLFVDKLLSTSVIDYHIGVTTTSVRDSSSVAADGRLNGNPNFVSRTTPDAIEVLKRNLIVGTNGASTEKSFEPVRLALTEPNLSGPNAGFFRKNAHLAIVFITDAEDQSDANSNAPEELYEFLLDLKGHKPERIMTFAVLVPTSDQKCPRDDSLTPLRIERFMDISKGETFGLCDSDYGQKLSELGRSLFDNVIETVYLEGGQPFPGTLKVTYGDQIIPEDPVVGWTFDPVKVALRFGKEIKWSNQSSGTSLKVEFLPVR